MTNPTFGPDASVFKKKDKQPGKEPASSAVIAELRRENKRIQERINAMQCRKENKARGKIFLIIAKANTSLGVNANHNAPKDLPVKLVSIKPADMNGAHSGAVAFIPKRPVATRRDRSTTPNQGGLRLPLTKPAEDLGKIQAILERNKDQKNREEERMSKRLRQAQGDRERVMNTSVHSGWSVHNKSTEKIREAADIDHKTAEEVRKKKQAYEEQLRLVVHESKLANEEAVSKSVTRLREQKAAKALDARREKSLLKEKKNENSLLAKEKHRKQRLMRELEREERKHLNQVKKIQNDMDRLGQEADKILKIKREAEGFVNKIHASE